MTDNRLPAWAQTIRRRYMAGEASMFILHGNVVDFTLYDESYYSLADFLAGVLLKNNKQVTVSYDPAEGIKVVKNRGKDLAALGGHPVREPKSALPMLEEILLAKDSAAVIINYAAAVVPAGEFNFLSEQDRVSLVTLHRWSLSQTIGAKDNVVFLISESLAEINSALIANPRIIAIDLPLPNSEQREAVIRQSDPLIDETHVRIFARHTAGLKAVQIAGLLTPRKSDELDDQDRRSFIEKLLQDPNHGKNRASKLAALTKGMGRDEIKHLIGPDKTLDDDAEAGQLDDYTDVLNLVSQRKREIIEKECSGLIEFLNPKHGLSAVGGCEPIVNELMHLARTIRSGHKAAVPMGLLLVGPMGSGKTFVANAFIKESGISAVRLKNFRSKWVGSTEANLEKVLGIVKSLGPLFLVIDEGDRAFGNTGDSDGGTSSRVIARIKEFMSDPDNRGHVVFILMTNRPDKLDLDIKRAGRLDRKIPFFYADAPDVIENILQALLRRYDVAHDLSWPQDRALVSAKLAGYSNADLEAVVLLAIETARRAQTPLNAQHMAAAIDDYLPTRDTAMLEYMELLAVFEASRRSMLPAKYRSITADELNQKLNAKRVQLRL